MKDQKNIIDELKKDIDTCKQIMSNDFILLNDVDGVNKGSIYSNIKEAETLGPHHSLPPDVDNECDYAEDGIDNTSTNPFAPTGANPLSIYCNQGKNLVQYKQLMMRCHPQFQSVLSSIEESVVGSFDSVSTVDELKDLCSRKLALIKGSGSNRRLKKLEIIE